MAGQMADSKKMRLENFFAPFLLPPKMYILTCSAQKTFWAKKCTPCCAPHKRGPQPALGTLTTAVPLGLVWERFCYLPPMVPGWKMPACAMYRLACATTPVAAAVVKTNVIELRSVSPVG